MKRPLSKLLLRVALAGPVCVLVALGAPVQAATSTNAIARIVIPKSEFSIPAGPDEGRDPFFPNSTRVFLNAAPKTGTDKQATPPSTLFVLKAISTSGARRVASINNRPFEAGEEGDIGYGATRVRIRCVEIRDDSVTIEINGQTQELRLRPNRKL